MALIAKACRKLMWLLSGDSSSNIQMVTFNLSDSLKSKIFRAVSRIPLGGGGGGVGLPDSPAVISPVFLFFQVGMSVTSITFVQESFKLNEINHE